MNKKPVLVIMAAGMGSRYGGLKQMDPIGPNGELIIDFSLYDAKRAGFESAVCIIKHEIEEDFKALINRGAAKKMDIKYAYQEIDDIPEGIEIPEGRVKPWGTSHAILAARDIIDGPFAVINADDYYGPAAFKIVYDFLVSAKDSEKYDYCMAAYKIENTLTEYGGVSRGICRMDEKGRLLGIEEAHKVQKSAVQIQYSLDEGESFIEIPEGTPVSMNFFGFTKSLMKELAERERTEIEKIIIENPVKGEYLLPATVSKLIGEGKAQLAVLECRERWYGVTYKEDRPELVEAMKQKKLEGLYPENLWA